MTLADPPTRKWTREEYHQMGDLGFFQDQRVQLIEGEIIEIAPQKNSHAITVSLVESALRKAFGEAYWVRSQLPIVVSDQSEPEPDVSVVQGGPRDYIGTDHPRNALLVVEVSDTTLRFDRKVKTSLYAAAGIREYWIVNLVDRQLEVFTQPITDNADARNSSYANNVIVKAGESITPIAVDERTAIVDLLP